MERLIQDFTVKEITTVSRLSDEDPTKWCIWRRSFPRVRRSPNQKVRYGDVFLLRGNFIACTGWYSVYIVIHFDSFVLNLQTNGFPFSFKVNATSIKVLENLDFHIMPLVELSVMIIGITTKTVQNINWKIAPGILRSPESSECDMIHDPVDEVDYCRVDGTD